MAIHRKLQDSWIWNKDKTFTKGQAWVDILLSVNHSEQRVLIGNEFYTVGPGESVKSIKTWANRWGWSRGKVRRFFDLLEKDNMVEFKTDTKTTHLSVCEWDTYQHSRTSNEHQKDINRTSVEHQTDINNNDNNVNNDNNGNSGAQKKIFENGEDKAEKPESKDEPDQWHGRTLEEWFDIFWEYYPDRGPKARNPKKRTKKYFTRIVEKEGEDPKIICYGAYIFRQAMSDRQGEDRRGIPMSATWLNDYEFQDWYKKYKKDNPDITKEKLLDNGFMPKQKAEEFSQDKFREPLENTRGQFRIYKLEGKEYFKPQEV